jgi:hypothetical protein
MAPRSAAVPAVDFKNVRRLMSPISRRLFEPLPHPARGRQKSRSPREALLAFLPRTAALLGAARHWTAPAPCERRFSNPSIQAACQPSKIRHFSRQIMALAVSRRPTARMRSGDSVMAMSAASGKFVQRNKVLN